MRKASLFLILVILGSLLTPAVIEVAAYVNGYIDVPGSYPDTLEHGKTQKYYVKVVNSGTETVKFKVHPYSWGGCIVDVDDGNIFDTDRDRVEEISAGTYKYLDFDVKTCNEGGSGYIFFQLYWQECGLFGCTDHYIASYSISLNVKQPTPDLTVTSVSVSTSTVHPGDSVKVTVKVKNQGTAASSSTYVGLYLDTKEYGTTTYLGNIYVSSLNPGQEITVYKTITIPDRNPGTYYINAFVDYQDNIKESNENNNINYATITLKPNPPKVYTPTITWSGTKATIKVKVEGYGITTVNFVWDDKNDLGIFHTTTKMSYAGSGYYTATIDFSGREGHKIGYYIEAKDSYSQTGRYPSSGENYFYVPTYPDLTVTSVSVSTSTVHPGD
ncbi:MAG: hypothetical protein H0Z24_09310, partial [Thermosipho sp. (in: Bacteria)]|nr:hypothetical protein [Thermosipho sp. (in: thermotogales)]